MSVHNIHIAHLTQDDSILKAASEGSPQSPCTWHNAEVQPAAP